MMLARTGFTQRSRIDTTKIPMRGWLYKPNYIRKFASITIAASGIGKSSLTIVEALAMVSGKALLGIEPESESPLRVAYWNGEDPLDELDRRFGAAEKYYELTDADIGDRLFYDSGRELPIVLAETDKNGTRVAVPVVDQVIQYLLHNRIDVLIIDPFISSHRVSENDNNAIDRVAKTWSEIADATNCSIMLVHHSRKVLNGSNGSGISVDDGRGASALLAAMRSGRALNGMTVAEADGIGLTKYERKLYFRSDPDLGKASMTRPAEVADWFKLASVDLENNPYGGVGGDEVGVVTAWEYPQKSTPVISNHEIRQAQDVIKAGGPFRADQRSTTQPWIGVPIATVLNFDLTIKQNKDRVQKLVSDWLALGYLKMVTQPDGSYHTRKFIEVGNRPPDDLP